LVVRQPIAVDYPCEQPAAERPNCQRCNESLRGHHDDVPFIGQGLPGGSIHIATFVADSRKRPAPLTKRFFSRSLLKLTHYRPLTLRTKKEQCSSYVLAKREEVMLKMFVEEAAALASIVLFVGMVAVWAQVIPQL
jgi:hypothetical protein